MALGWGLRLEEESQASMQASSALSYSLQECPAEILQMPRPSEVTGVILAPINPHSRLLPRASFVSLVQKHSNCLLLHSTPPPSPPLLLAVEGKVHPVAPITAGVIAMGRQTRDHDLGKTMVVSLAQLSGPKHLAGTPWGWGLGVAAEIS